MKAEFIFKNDDELYQGRFSIYVTQRNGLEYKYISGNEPVWQDVICAVTAVFLKAGLPSKEGPYFFEDCYVIIPDNRLDCRFIPLLVNTKNGKTKKLPITIDDGVIFEHYFKVSFRMAIRILMALSMSYGVFGFEVDQEKWLMLNTSKNSNTVLEMR